MAYNPTEIEKKSWDFWNKNEVYKITNDTSKPKYYVLDMFPYPSGAGLHVGHPLGYVASDIYSRYKRLSGFNVLHPMGFDAFGLPAEQYAIQTGKHPAETTAENVKTYRKQLDNIGLSYDWSRKVETSDPQYYKWTQWIFTKLYNHCYCMADDKAQPIDYLVKQFEENGNLTTKAYTDFEGEFSAIEWKEMSAKEQSDLLMHYRLAYRKVAYVNWCEKLGTVLANDEVVNGLSERGGFPVIQKPMLQWSLRITAYAQRLLDGLKDLSWSTSLIAQQENWIGRSEGAKVIFNIENQEETLDVFTTRPDTIFGVTFMVLAPEHPYVNQITTAVQKDIVSAYQETAKSKSAIDRQAGKQVSGVDTGAFAIHPFTGKKIPIWISDYVLIDYGTGAIMAVPSDDDRDRAFAEKMGIEIIEICDKSDYPNASNADKTGKMINSDFLNGLEVKKAIKLAIHKINEQGIGEKKINYKLRDANFSRQRYWGEPFPIYYTEDGIPHTLPGDKLPLELPPLDDFSPKDGKAPLSRAKDWTFDGNPLDIDTMPGNAGSSWYFLRYMDPDNTDKFCSKAALDYWQDVDLYIGGTEHAVGHLMYARFWHKFLYDMGKVPTQEPFKKLINQGMIQGVIETVYLDKKKVNGSYRILCAGMVEKFEDEEDFIKLPVPIEFVKGYGSAESYLSLSGLKYFLDWRPEYSNAIFECSNGVFHNGEYKAKDKDAEKSGPVLYTFSETGKMSKSKHNVVNPDDIIAKYGADCFRMFEMFLGPIETAKPWDTKGIEGVSKFLRKFWGLFEDMDDNWLLVGDEPTEDELKSLHTCIKKVNADIERFSFNTCVSAFMICVKEMYELKCHKRAILSELVKLISPFAPFTAEELWHKMGNEDSVVKDIVYPKHDEKYLVKSTIEYPISINGKMRVKIELAATVGQDEAKAIVMANLQVQKWTEGKELRKFIFVPGRIINIVV